MNILRRAYHDIGKGRYLDRYAALLLALLAGILSALGITDARVSLTVILACLVLISLSGIEVNRSLELLQYAAYAPSKGNRLVIMSDESYRPYIQDALRVRMLTLANYRFLAANSAEFGKLLDSGGSIEVIMLLPTSDWGLRTVTSRSLGASQNRDHIVGQVNFTVEKLAEFAERAKAPEQVVGKQTPYPAPFVLTIIDYRTRGSIVMLVPSSFRQPLEERPTIVVQEEEDAKAVQFFTNYFDHLWSWPETRQVGLPGPLG